MAKVTKAIVVCPIDKEVFRDPDYKLAEAVGLAAAINLDVVLSFHVKVGRISPATYISSGIVENIAREAEEKKAELLIVDTQLSPVQQRNLERAYKIKVIDRIGLILEIFGARARTREGKLQVDLAMLTYQRSRLVGAWTHLERQRGGGGFTGGPGETQKELDRRKIDDQIVRLKKQLADVQRTRALHRKSRTAKPFPIVALVGYTNAGKSTLFNRLTGAKVMAEDLLFATLDPTMRQTKLPSGRQVILSDTVGFIDDLPTHLIAAFRATLEEVMEADLILHVQDVTHREADVQADAVLGVLADLGIDTEKDTRVIDVANKIDLLPASMRARMVRKFTDGGAMAISAAAGAGIPQLLSLIDARLAERDDFHEYVLPIEDGEALAWLYSHGEVTKRKDNKKTIRVGVLLATDRAAQFEKRFLAA
ncbi:MAG TPA: GTPase HflX [Alphaproteobacteria bacterium]|nr:GTPase HflX [Alphaproteobacteria bacterium]